MSSDGGTGYLTGNLLIAMPQMPDPRFQRTLIYICAHNADGAMGLIVNQLVDNVSFPELLEQLKIGGTDYDEQIRVHFGGPVEASRGFVLHSDDYVGDGTLVVEGGIALTATLEILRSIAGGEGPRKRLLALGYAGWGPGQLDEEIQANGWLNVDADENLVFDTELDSKWERAINKIGVDLGALSTGDAGHA